MVRAKTAAEQRQQQFCSACVLLYVHRASVLTQTAAAPQGKKSKNKVNDELQRMDKIYSIEGKA